MGGICGLSSWAICNDFTRRWQVRARRCFFGARISPLPFSFSTYTYPPPLCCPHGMCSCPLPAPSLFPWPVVMHWHALHSAALWGRQVIQWGRPWHCGSALPPMCRLSFTHGACACPPSSFFLGERQSDAVPTTPSHRDSRIPEGCTTRQPFSALLSSVRQLLIAAPAGGAAVCCEPTLLRKLKPRRRLLRYPSR